MKKIISGLAIFTVLSVFAVPLAVFAAEFTGGPNECCKLRRTISIEGKDFSGIVGSSANATCVINGQPAQVATEDARWGIICGLNVLNSVIDWAFVILIGIAGLFVIIGAMNLLLSAGSQEKITAGRDYILYALVGVAVAFLARAIPSIVKLIVGV